MRAVAHSSVGLERRWGGASERDHRGHPSGPVRPDGLGETLASHLGVAFSRQNPLRQNGPQIGLDRCAARSAAEIHQA